MVNRPTTSTLSDWTDERLAALMERYRRKYWPRSRRVRRYRIQVASLVDNDGEIDPAERVLRVDIGKHTSERGVRATVLHEMIHAAVGIGHGVHFWAEMERLLKLRAPIAVGFPEMGEQTPHLCRIPKRFPRCRARFRPIYLRQLREMQHVLWRTVTPEMIANDCYDAALDGVMWRAIWSEMARRCGFIDMDGRTLPSAQRYRRACRRAYQRGRRYFLEDQRIIAQYGPTEEPRLDDVQRGRQ